MKSVDDAFDRLFLAAPVVERVVWPAFDAAGVEVSVLREDLRHPVLGGNKLWKLRYNLEAFASSGCAGIVTLGGAYSNHVRAISEACALRGIPLHVFVRGDEAVTNERLERIKEQGTRLHFVTREEYRQRSDEDVIRMWMKQHGIAEDFFVIPEGADNAHGRKGCVELGALVSEHFDAVICAMGTGSTLRGMAEGVRGNTRVIGIPVGRFGTWGIKHPRVEIHADYAWAGYGKSHPDLEKFMDEFSAATGIPLEPVYTGKLFYAVVEMVKKGQFTPGENMLLLHSGGV